MTDLITILPVLYSISSNNDVLYIDMYTNGIYVSMIIYTVLHTHIYSITVYFMHNIW